MTVRRPNCRSERSARTHGARTHSARSWLLCEPLTSYRNNRFAVAAARRLQEQVRQPVLHAGMLGLADEIRINRKKETA